MKLTEQQIDEAHARYNAGMDEAIAEYRKSCAGLRRDIDRVFWRFEKWCLGIVVVSGILLAVSYWWPK